LQAAIARSLTRPAAIREEFTSSKHACCAALRRVATSRLAASSQARTRWGLALGASLDNFLIARTQAVSRCPRLADELGGATPDPPAGGAGDVLVPAVEDLLVPAVGDPLVPAVEDLPVPAVDDLPVPAVAGAPVAPVEVPVGAVDAAPLVDVTVLVLLWPQPATSSPTARARPRAGRLRTPCVEVPGVFTNWLSRRSQRR
jgi:hypothetical protein